MTRTVIGVAVGLAVVAAWHAGRLHARGENALKSGIVTMAETQKLDSGVWGEFRAHFNGSTVASGAVLAGVAQIEAGQEIHPPHTHVDEEFIFLVEGSGTWHVGGRDVPARTGDVLYTEPNVVHGIKNTSDKPLKFVVAKWLPKP
jgi:quercetin dioxygenase-like cupin family protein